MQISKTTADAAVLEELGARLRQRRLDRNLSQAELAETAGVGRVTLQRIEVGQSVSMTNFVRILRTLDLLDGIDRWIPEPAPSPIEEMRRRGRRRRRAGAPRDTGDTQSRPWRWGDEEEA